MRREESIINFFQLIEYGDWSDLNLTIYYLGPFILTPFPVTESSLIDGFRESKTTITVPGERLQEYADLLNQLYSLNLIPVEVESRMDVRLVYVFEAGNGKEVLRVSMWVGGDSMFVNGREVEASNILNDIIIPFLPEEIAQEFQSIINRD